MGNYPAYPEYKDSKIKWLDLLPAHWGSTKIKFYYDIQLGKMLQPQPLSQNDEEVEYLKALNVQWERVIFDDLPKMWASPKDKKKYAVQNGDLLICEGGEVGRTALLEGIEGDCIIQNALHRVRGTEKANINYLKYLMRHIADAGWFDILCNKSTIAHLTGEKLDALELPLPYPEEQQVIAHFLDDKTAQIDGLIAKKEALLARLAEKRTALISQAVTKGLDPTAPMKDSNIPWLGHIPAHWELKKLHHIARLKSGESITTNMMDENDEYPVFGGNGLRGHYHKYTHLGDYVLIGRQGALCGNINYASGRFWASEHALVVSPTQDIAPRWLGELLRTMNLNQYSVSAAQPGLSAEYIGRLKVPFPIFDEQVNIAHYLIEETSKIDLQRVKIEKAVTTLKEYRTALITSAVTGKIDVRNMVSAM